MRESLARVRRKRLDLGGASFTNWRGVSELQGRSWRCRGIYDGTGWCRLLQRGSSARLMQARLRTPWSTQEPLATVPRGDGHVLRSCVDLVTTIFLVVLGFPWGLAHSGVCGNGTKCPCQPIIPVRGCLKFVRMLLQEHFLCVVFK